MNIKKISLLFVAGMVLTTTIHLCANPNEIRENLENVNRQLDPTSPEAQELKNYILGIANASSPESYLKQNGDAIKSLLTKLDSKGNAQAFIALRSLSQYGY